MVPFSNTDGVWNSFPLQQHAITITISVVNSDCTTHVAEASGPESGTPFRLELLKNMQTPENTSKKHLHCRDGYQNMKDEWPQRDYCNNLHTVRTSAAFKGALQMKRPKNIETYWKAAKPDV